MIPGSFSVTSFFYSTDSSSDTDIGRQLEEVRRSNLPFKDLIHFADMWFNLKNNPIYPIQPSNQVKEQLLRAVSAYVDANNCMYLTASSDPFSVQDLSWQWRVH